MRSLIDVKARLEHVPNTVLISGRTANDSRRAVKSLGDTDPVSTRPTMRSKS